MKRNKISGVAFFSLFILLIFSHYVYSFEFDVGIVKENISEEIYIGDTFYYIKNITLNDAMILSLAGIANINFEDSETRLYNKNVSIRQSTYHYEFTPSHVGEYKFYHEFRLGGQKYETEIIFSVIDLEIPDETSQNASQSQIENETEVYSKDTIISERVELPYVISFSENYYYDYGPVILIGNVSLDEEYYSTNFSANFTISSLNNNISSECVIDFNKSRMFYCELQTTGIELSDYEIMGVVSYYEDDIKQETPFKHKFNLGLRDEENIKLDIFYNSSIESGESQEIKINAYDNNRYLSGAEVLVRIKDVHGNTKTFSANDLGNGTFVSSFDVWNPGGYDLEVTFVLGTRYRNAFESFIVEAKNKTMEINLDNISDGYILHNYGPLNISGNFSIPNYDFRNRNVSVELFDVNGQSRHCDFGCDVYCTFVCELRQNILYDDYELNITFYDGELAYSESFEFIVGLSKAENIEFSLDYSDYYLIEEMQHFFLTPSRYGELVYGESLHVEITDPLNISYGVTTQKTYDGYMFNFIGLVPGEYTLEIKLLTKEGLKIEKFSYTVIDEYSVLKDETHISIARRERDIRKALSTEKLLEFSESNELSLYIQLPSRINENVRWLRISKENYSSKRNYDFIKRINLMNYINRKLREDFQNLRLHYIETEKIPHVIRVHEDYKEIEVKDHISPFSDEYIDIDIFFTFDDMSKVSKENLLVYEEIDNQRNIIRNVRYFDDSGNNLIDGLSFIASNISGRKFIVEQSVDITSFIIPEDVQGIQNSQTRFVVKYANPDIRVSELPPTQCSLVINNITHTMVPVKTENAYVLHKVFERPGRFDYKIFCGQNVIESSFNIRPKRTDMSSSSLRSNIFNKGEKERLSVSSQIPVNFYRHGSLQDIQRDFIPRISDNRIDSLHYIVEKGLFNVSLGSLNNEFPFSYSNGDVDINFRLDSLVFYDIVSMESAVFARPDQLSNYVSDNNILTYSGVFGEDTKLMFTYRSAELKKELLLSNSTLVVEPIDFGMDRDNTYVMMKSVIDIGDFIIDSQSTYDEIYIRTEDFVEAGVYIKRDYYYLPGDERNRRAMFRVIYEEDGLYYMLSGIPYNEFKNYEEIIFDPTFSILSNNRDAMSYDDVIVLDYYDEESQYLFFGRNGGEVYEAGLQFELNVPKNAIITDAFVSLTSGENQSGSVNTRIFVENTTNSAVFSSGAGRISDREYHIDYVEWNITSSWDDLTNYDTANISNLIQYIVDKEDWESGNYISIMLTDDGSSTGYRSFHGYSSPGTSVPVLSVTYLSEESEPIISLSSPEDNEIIANENVTFEYLVEDDEGIGACALWGNFTGTWQLNQTDAEVSTGETNNFTILDLNDGVYEWNVWCVDTMGNNAFSSNNFTFTLNTTAEPTTLEVFSDHNTTSNISLFQEVGFYAEFLDSELNPIEDAVCKIEFGDYEGDMIYDSTQLLYNFNRTFETPYLQQYNITCSKVLYEDTFETSELYIYPIVNSSIEKEINKIENGYSVKLTFRNEMNISAFINVTDFVTDAFFEIFDQIPVSSSSVSGSFDGNIHNWNILLGPNERGTINYNITPILGSYSIFDLQLISMSSYLD